MSLFVSRRERRLWAWTLAVVVAIYGTLGLARSLAGMLRNTGIGEWLFVVGCLLVLAAVVTQGLTIRPRGVELAVALGVAAAYLLVFVRMAVPAERTHLVEYGVVAILIDEALRERVSNGRRVPFPALLAVAATSLIGAIDESIQALIPSRVFALTDIAFNILAAVMAVSASAALHWARRQVGRRRETVGRRRSDALRRVLQVRV